MESFDICGIDHPWFWDWDWEGNACIRRTVFEGAVPLSFLLVSLCVGDFARPGVTLRTGKPLSTQSAGAADNRVWIGPLVVMLLLSQAGIQGMEVAGIESAVLGIGWLVVALLATLQWAKYLRSDMSNYHGLFSGVVFGFVAAQLCCCLVEMYFGFFVRTQWRTPIWGVGLSAVAAVLHAKTLVNALIIVLLLIVHPLPQLDYMSDAIPAHLRDGHYSGVRRLTGKINVRQESPELRSSILSNMMFRWMTPFIEKCLERQAMPSDLYVQPDRYHVQFAQQRYITRGQQVREYSLGLQLISVFRFEIFVQIALNLYGTFSNYIQPYLMQRVLRFIDEYSEDRSIGLRFGYFLAAMMLLTSILGTVVEQQQQWHSRSLVMYMRNVLVEKLSNKTLRRRAKESSTQPDTEGKFGGKESTDGRVYNILTADISRLSKAPAIWNIVLVCPTQLIIGCVYMYSLVGIGGLVGTSLIFVVMAVGKQLMVRAKNIEAELGLFNDARLAIVSEVVRGISSVKLFGWGTKFIQIIGEKRTKQLATLWQRAKIWTLLNLWTESTLPFIIFVMLLAYSLGGQLDGETTFTTIAVFKILQRSVSWLPSAASEAISVYVSLKRIEAYLDEEEVQPVAERVDPQGSDIGFDGAELVWHLADESDSRREEPQGLLDTSSDTSAQKFVLRNLNVRFPLGKLTVIGGPTGSGKSSLLSALIGEMTLVHGKVLIPVSSDWSLHSVAYVSQEAWLRNATIRDNVLFGSPYDQSRYEETLRMCGLKPDLRIFSAGDLTEIGERGITLSGGQKQRVALARAVYSSCQILLIDDCLSAVDSHTGKHILHECLLSQSPMMHGRTRILVTHHMAMCLPHCQYVVMMRSGEIVAQGSPLEVSQIVAVEELSDSELLTEDMSNVRQAGLDDPVAEDGYNEQRALLSATATPGRDGALCSSLPVGQLIKDEERMRGMVKVDVWRRYLSASGSWSFVSSWLFLIIIAQLLGTYKDYYLAQKVGSDKTPGDGSSQYIWLIVYLSISLLSSVLVATAMLLIYTGSLRASVILHEQLLRAVIYATPRFMDTTPIGRTLARFSKDFYMIDEDIGEIAFYFIRAFIIAFTTLIVISTTVPLFAVVGVCVLFLYSQFTWRFMQSQREVKRLESTMFAPLLSLYSELIQGVTSIRTFGMRDAYMEEIRVRYIEHTQADFVFRATRRWLGSRMGTTSSLVGCAATVMILWKIEYFSSGLAGFVLIYAVNFWMESLSVIRRYSNLELSLNAVERVGQYLEIDQEAPSKSSVGNKPCPGWPLRGEIEVRDLVAGYFANEPVLHGLSFSVRAGEKIGIVGRTGAGKSTLSLSLLRFVEATSGQVLIDGVDISKIGLEDLRQNITIIPQDPVLFNGTIRFNLDPFSEYPDEILLDALKRTLLLKSAHGSAGDQGIAVFDSLDDEIISNGQNLSLGQRQLMALARTLTRRSKVILMDEATASVDFETDEAMQRTIRGAEFKSSTILCIAHRLRTIIDYDRVLVLENGRVEEFGTPAELIQAEGGVFRTLCEKSGELDVLVNMACGNLEA